MIGSEVFGQLFKGMGMGAGVVTFCCKCINCLSQSKSRIQKCVEFDCLSLEFLNNLEKAVYRNWHSYGRMELV